MGDWWKEFDKRMDSGLKVLERVSLLVMLAGAVVLVLAVILASLH